MPSIVYSIDSKTGNKFAYETYTYRDPETNKTRTKKKYLGRVDPITGEIIPKGTDGKRSRSISTKQMEAISQKDEDRIKELSQENDLLKERLSQIEQQMNKKDDFINAILNISRDYQEAR
jgi:hypothetical protein